MAGACIGALFFGQLTDRFGRKRLFILTLGVYIVATVATAFAFAPWYLYLARFFTGAGIGGIRAQLDQQGPLDRDALFAAVRGGRWGPGRFRAALRSGIADGSITPLAKGRYARPA